MHEGTAPLRNSVPHGTYAQFGNRGDKLIATYHGDHAFSFDVTASEQPPVAAFCLPPPDEARYTGHIPGPIHNAVFIGVTYD